MPRYFVRSSEFLRKIAADATGVASTEYGLIATGIAVAIITAVGMLGDGLANLFGDLEADLAKGAPATRILGDEGVRTVGR